MLIIKDVYVHNYYIFPMSMFFIQKKKITSLSPASASQTGPAEAGGSAQRHPAPADPGPSWESTHQEHMIIKMLN